MPRLELTILMPCLNEAETLADCVRKAKDYLSRSGIEGEVLIADNGSSDGSPGIAEAHGARVVAVAQPGYGSALQGGIDAALGRYIIMGDADGSYDFAALDAYVAKLREGFDLVMGNRFAGGIAPGAMPFLHRYLGNPVLSFLGRLFFGGSVRDFHCGLRGFSKDAVTGLDLRTSGMEFASEMIVKAILRGLRIAEVPTTLAPDGRSRPPHLRTWRDGWRHLRFLLLFSPRWLFLVPGVAMTCAGTLAMAALIPGPLPVGSVVFDIHTMLYAGVAVIVGLQICGFAVFSKVVAMVAGLVPPDPGTEAIVRQASLERGLVIGGILSLIGVAGALYGVLEWRAAEFGPLVATSMMRVAIPSLTVLAAGVQVMFASFFLSTLRLIPR